MKNKIILSLVILLLLMATNAVKAASGTAVKSGSWTTASTWLIGGMTRIPTCGDTITIPTGDTVTVNTQIDLTGCSTSLYVKVDSGAVFSFTNGNKLDLPCGSTVRLMPYATLKKATAGGGNSTLISICDTTEWNAGDGPITGPATFHRGPTLPVTWLAADAKVVGKTVEITWSTAEEINNNYFTVEKTIDGIHYEIVGKTDGAGTSTAVHHYQLTDYAPYAGPSYYRVKQTDYDGQSDYSRLLPVNLKLKTATINIYPNPSNNAVFVSLPSSIIKSNAVLHIMDMKGSEVITPLAITSALLTIDLNSLAGGVYMIQLVSDDGVQQSKLVKE